MTLARYCGAIGRPIALAASSTSRPTSGFSSATVFLLSSEVTGNLPRRGNGAQDRHFRRAARIALRAAAVEAAHGGIGIDRAARLAAKTQAADALVGIGLRDGRDQ